MRDAAGLETGARSFPWSWGGGGGVGRGGGRTAPGVGNALQSRLKKHRGFLLRLFRDLGT